MNSEIKRGPVRTAVLLAAGMGSRLSPLTITAHKCLTEVNGVPILEQQVRCLEEWGFEELIVIVGHKSDQIQEFLAGIVSSLNVRYVLNPQYRTTNNLYSLWLAREAIERPFLLLECDLFFEASLLSEMLVPDRIALATQQPWMDGTTVTLDVSRRVSAFQIGALATRNRLAYKTVNINSLSLSTWHLMKRRLDEYVSSGKVNDYYEAVFSDMAVAGAFKAQAVNFDDGNWYEIDTPDDLSAAEALFANSRPRNGQSLPMKGVARNFTRLGQPMSISISAALRPGPAGGSTPLAQTA